MDILAVQQRVLIAGFSYREEGSDQDWYVRIDLGSQHLEYFHHFDRHDVWKTVAKWMDKKGW